MALKDKILKLFSSSPEMNVTKPSDKVAATTTITNDLISYLIGLSSFDTMDSSEIYEQLYIWEPEIGSAIDRMATMVGESYKYCTVKQSVIMTDTHHRMIGDANRLADELDIRNYFEQFAEIIAMHGDLFLEYNNMAVDILPNRYVTIVDSLDRIRAPQPTVMTDEQYLVLYEGDPVMQRVIPREKFIHVKYKSTPVFCNDVKGRKTWGLYSTSPLQRVVLSVWWKRLTMITDTMWRIMNVPREHHQVSAEMFNLNNYTGDMNSRRQQAREDAQRFLSEYVSQMKRRMPDQAYATLDSVKITKLDNRSGSYMQTNELLNQINSQIWMALNMPRSMISGESTGSYASELVIANYVTQKVNQIAHRIKPVILRILRDRLRAINSSYPVDDLDLFMDLDIAVSELERFRQIAIMADVGVFTEDEIREFVQYKPLTDEQRSKIVRKEVKSSSTSVPTDSSPETPISRLQHATDSGDNVYKEIER